MLPNAGIVSENMKHLTYKLTRKNVCDESEIDLKAIPNDANLKSPFQMAIFIVKIIIFVVKRVI